MDGFILIIHIPPAALLSIYPSHRSSEEAAASFAGRRRQLLQEEEEGEEYFTDEELQEFMKEYKPDWDAHVKAHQEEFENMVASIPAVEEARRKLVGEDKYDEWKATMDRNKERWKEMIRTGSWKDHVVEESEQQKTKTKWENDLKRKNPKKRKMGESWRKEAVEEELWRKRHEEIKQDEALKTRRKGQEEDDKDVIDLDQIDSRSSVHVDL